MSTKDYDAVVIAARRGAYTLWIAMDGRDVEVSFRPGEAATAAALEASLLRGHTLVVTVEAGLFIRGIRLK